MTRNYDHHWRKGLDKRKGLPVDTKSKDQIELAKKLLRKSGRKRGKAYGKIYCRQLPRPKPLPMSTIVSIIEADNRSGIVPPWEGPDEFAAGMHPASQPAPVLVSTQTRRPHKPHGEADRKPQSIPQPKPKKVKAWQQGPLATVQSRATTKPPWYSES
jgi:hypothetical protein